MPTGCGAKDIDICSRSLLRRLGIEAPCSFELLPVCGPPRLCLLERASPEISLVLGEDNQPVEASEDDVQEMLTLAPWATFGWWKCLEQDRCFLGT